MTCRGPGERARRCAFQQNDNRAVNQREQHSTDLQFLASHAPTTRAVAVLALTLLWAVRLAGYIFIRNRGKGEDFRYQAMRRKYGPRFWLVSLFTVFLFQGLIMVIVFTPIQETVRAAAPANLTLFDYCGAAIVLAGRLFETIADRQLFVFKSRPENKGQPLRSGLWRYSRHPNYFGEALVWIGMSVMALSVPGGATTVASPLLMLFLLLNVSGIPLLKKEFDRRPAYREYMENTSAFIPLPPKG
mgnify:CR=1 FL=1